MQNPGNLSWAHANLVQETRNKIREEVRSKIRIGNVLPARPSGNTSAFGVPLVLPLGNVALELVSFDVEEVPKRA